MATEYLTTVPSNRPESSGDLLDKSRLTSSDSDIPSPKGLTYLPYQKAAIDFATDNNALMADEMGLGKTVQALGTANNLGSERILVIAPATLLGNWQKESDKWLIEDPPVHLVKDGKDSSWTAPSSGPAVVIISYSNLGGHRERIRDSKWDMVILDEGHYIGNLDSQRTQEILGCVQDACNDPNVSVQGDSIESIKADRKLVLTGTPFDTSTDQLFPIISYLAPQHWGPPTHNNQDAFRQHYYDSTAKAGKNLEDLQENLRNTVMIRRTEDDVHDQVPLPPIQRRTVILNPNTLEEKIAANEHGDNNIPPTEADLISNPAKFTEMSRLLKDNSIAKAPQVANYVANAAEKEPIVFFSNYPDVLKIVASELDSRKISNATIDGAVAKIERSKTVSDFQDGEIDVILLSLNTGKEGITLTRSRRAIFADLSWRPTDILQAEKRIHRLGQKSKSVLIEYMVLNNSLDGHQADIMAKKIYGVSDGVGLSKSAEDLGAPVEPGNKKTANALDDEIDKYKKQTKQEKHKNSSKLISRGTATKQQRSGSRAGRGALVY